MQRNCRMNALTAKFWFGRWRYVTFYPLPPINCAFSNRNSITNEIALEEHRNEPCFFSPLWNAKPQILGEVFSLVCTLRNSNIAIRIDFVIAILNLLSCEKHCMISQNENQTWLWTRLFNRMKILRLLKPWSLLIGKNLEGFLIMQFLGMSLCRPPGRLMGHLSESTQFIRDDNIPLKWKS